MQQKKSGKMAYVFQVISIIPLILFGLVILLLSMQLFKRVMYREVEQELAGVARNIESAMNLAYPGDYHLEGDISLSIYKGDHDITREYLMIDQFKENCGCDITLFYKDTSILTTMLDKSGARLIGKGASNLIVRDVLETGNTQFYPNTSVFGVKYFCYYLPLKNSDGTIAGMLLAAKPSDYVNNAVRSASYPLMLTAIIAAIIISVFIHLYTRKFDLVLQHIRSFLSSVSTGNLTAELDSVVLKRNDEFGDIGRSAVQMQQALRKTVETDALTELNNRRSGERKLLLVIDRARVKETPFSVCIGDIDYFKKVNDTYGHAGGDIVLKAVSDTLRQHMNSIGFTARWGGEEFLLVFDHMDIAASEKSLWDLLEKIRQLEIPYEGHLIHVTMTFGLAAGDATKDKDSLLHIADDKLYLGKTSGRNRVIS